MDDRIKIAIGLAMFLTVATLPFWMGFGKAIPSSAPPVTTVQGQTGQGEREQCVEPAAWMRPNHMQLLNDWRNSVVREGKRTYINAAGRQFDKSLTKTCLNCHSDQATLAKGGGVAGKAAQVSSAATLASSGNHGAPQPVFCDQCHQSVGVKPYCFSCHLVPVE